MSTPRRSRGPIRSLAACLALAGGCAPEAGDVVGGTAEQVELARAARAAFGEASGLDVSAVRIRFDRQDVLAARGAVAWYDAGSGEGEMSLRPDLPPWALVRATWHELAHHADRVALDLSSLADDPGVAVGRPEAFADLAEYGPADLARIASLTEACGGLLPDEIPAWIVEHAFPEAAPRVPEAVGRRRPADQRVVPAAGQVASAELVAGEVLLLTLYDDDGVWREAVSLDGAARPVPDAHLPRAEAWSVLPSALAAVPDDPTSFVDRLDVDRGGAGRLVWTEVALPGRRALAGVRVDGGRDRSDGPVWLDAAGCEAPPAAYVLDDGGLLVVEAQPKEVRWWILDDAP